jgi:ornithine--oxo-acid transaminase
MLPFSPVAPAAGEAVVTVIRPHRGWCRPDVAALWSYRELFGFLALRDIQVLCQVSGDDNYIIKLLPALTIDAGDRGWIVEAFDEVIGDCHQIGGAVWDLGRSLAKHSLKARAGAA